MGGWIFSPKVRSLLALENRGWCSHQTERLGSSLAHRRMIQERGKNRELTQSGKKTCNYEDEVIAEDGWCMELWGRCLAVVWRQKWKAVSSELGPSSEQSSSSAGGPKSICSAAVLGSEGTVYPRAIGRPLAAGSRLGKPMRAPLKPKLQTNQTDSACGSCEIRLAAWKPAQVDNE